MRLKFTVLPLILVFGIGYLFVAGFRQSQADHMTVSALARALAAGEVEDRRIQLAGQVVDGSVQWDQYRHRAEFTVGESGAELAVHYVGNALLPDTFKDGSPVVLEGRWRAADGVFAADVVFAKCPSKYDGQSYDGHLAVNTGG